MAMTLIEKIRKTINPKLLTAFGIANVHALPRLEKVVINVGVRSDNKDPKTVEHCIEDLRIITGQQPIKTRARKSISSFNVREGQVVGLMVTLRGKRMYAFVDKLLNVALARVRDFRGLDPKSLDGSGNFSIGFRDQIPFPEISADSIKYPFGLQVTLVVQANSRQLALEFLKQIGLPLKQAIS